MSEFTTLQVGDFVTMNPKIIVEAGLYGRVQKIGKDGHPLVYFPEVHYHWFGMHSVAKCSLGLLQNV